MSNTVAAEPRPAEGSLWRDRDFRKLWTASTISRFGSQITGVALPITAVVILSATPGQMGLLTALGQAPIVLVGLFAGVWVDRLRRRPILVGTDLARAALLAAVPLAFMFGMLHMWQLYVVAVLAGGLTVFSDVASHSYLPSLLSRNRLVEGNSRLGASDSVAEVAGPSLGGILAQVVSAPLAILIDAASFVVSGGLVAAIRKPEPPPAPHGEFTVWQDIAEGLRFVTRNRLLRGLLGNEGMAAFFGNFIGVSYNLFVLRELGLSPAILGLSIGAGGAGALVAAFLSGRIIRRFGLGRALSQAQLYTALIAFGYVLAGGPPWLATAILLTTQFVGDISWGLYFIANNSLRQSVVPDHLLGRSSASTRVVVGALAMVGALIAGLAGDAVGLRLTMLVGVLGILLSTLWLFLTPVASFREEHVGSDGPGVPTET